MNGSKYFPASLAILLLGCGQEVDEHAGHDHVASRTQAAFVNGSFESGTNNQAPPNWLVAAYTNQGVSSPFLGRASLNLLLNTSNPSTNLVTITRVTTNGPESEPDPTLGTSATLRWPKYGNAVALVNNVGSGAIANSLRQEMTLTTSDIDPADGKPHVRFTVAPVLQDGAHPFSQQPYYFVQLKNVTKNTILYQDYNASAQPGVPWKVLNGVTYTDWQLVDIAPGEAAMGLGDQLELEVIASRCQPTGHFGRVYVDGVGSTIPGLFVSGTAPSGANRGTNVTYQLAYTNGGTGAAGNVVIDFNVPTDTTWVGLSAPGYSCTQPAVGATGVASCNVGTVAPGASGTFSVTVNINSASSTNLITAGHYEIRGTGVNPLLGPKMFTNVTTNAVYADLGISKTNHVGGVGWGQEVAYEIVATNSGPSAVTGATVTDNFPAQFTVTEWTCTGSGGGVCGTASGTSNIAASVDLPVGANATFQVLGHIIAGSGSGTITNSATITAPGGVSDTNTTNNAAVDSDPIGELRSITVRKYGDAGTVSSVPSAISCGPSCSSTTGAFVAGMTITLNAVPGPGETFLGWGGHCSGTSTACTFTVGTSVDVYAIFEADPRANGLACTAGSQCASGQCVDGVCCNTACGADADDCQSCAVPGSEGTCTPLSAGTICKAAGCSDGVVTPAATCNGSATACTATAPVSCDGLACAGSACLPSCQDNDDCVSGHYCDASGGTCEPLVAQGSACDSDVECGSGNCVDGVCCNVACDGQCEACNLPAAPGVCLPVTGAPTGGRLACETDGSPCGGSCNGALRTACAYPTNTTTCVSASCSAGVATVQTGCDAAGHCPTPASQNCGEYACGEAACLGDCTTDDDCSAGNYCSAGICAPEHPAGGACSRDGECGTGNCVDGVCCDTGCDGQCEACNLAGSEGICSAVTGNPIGPRAACASDGSLCAGSCDGSEREACTYPGAGIECRAAGCALGVATLSAACDGAGACPTEQTQDCGSFLCGADACDGDCEADTDCAADSYCSAGVCVPELPLGSACSGANQCASENCVDGVCCDTACTGQCEACDVAGSEGTCSAVEGAPHGARTACATDGSLCGGACDGDARDACAFPTGTTSCRAPSCSDDVATLAAACDGQGNCPGIQVQDCGDFVCGLTACRGDCSRTADCAIDSFCSGGVCVPELDPGSACSAAEQCASGNCVDGVCCNTACDDQCAACDVEGSEGTCTAVVGSPRGGRAACLGQGDCRGACDGVDVDTCSFPGEEVTCSNASCEAGFEREAGRCDGAGLCSPSTPTSCENYACDGDSCGTSCSANADCVASFVCVDGECTAAPEPEEPEQPEEPTRGGRISGGGLGCSVGSTTGSSTNGPLGTLLVLGAAVGFSMLRRRRADRAA